MTTKSTIIYEDTVPATFVRRINRFTAEVLMNGEPEIVHVKNTGRLGELLVPDAKITLQRVDDPKRKTAYDLISVYKSKLKWVNIDSLAPNALMKQALNQMNYDLVKPEFGSAMREAAKAGVQIVYYGCLVEADSIKITSVVEDTDRYLR